MRNNFLKYCWKKSRLFSLGLFCFVLLQLFFSYKSVETFPFLNYGMYSAAIAQQDSLGLLQVRVDGHLMDADACGAISADFLNYNLHYYHSWRASHFSVPIRRTIQKRLSRFLTVEQLDYCEDQLANLPKDEQAFSEWLKRYLQRCCTDQIETIELIYSYHSSSYPYAELSRTEYQVYPVGR